MTHSLIGEITQCQAPLEDGKLCDRTLGPESRDNDIPYCATHRICTSCNTLITIPELVLQMRELPTGETLKQEILKCARCKLQDLHMERQLNKQNAEVKVTQVELDFLNLCRLAVCGDTEILLQETDEAISVGIVQQLIVNMDFEQKCAAMKRLEHCAVAMSVAVMKDKSSTFEQVQARKRLRYAESLTTQANGKETPLENKDLITSYEREFNEYMVQNNLKDPKHARKLFKRFKKQVKMASTILNVELVTPPTAKFAESLPSTHQTHIKKPKLSKEERDRENLVASLRKLGLSDSQIELQLSTATQKFQNITNTASQDKNTNTTTNT